LFFKRKLGKELPENGLTKQQELELPTFIFLCLLPSGFLPTNLFLFFFGIEPAIWDLL